MKIYRDEEFSPITVVFETRKEAMAYRDFIGRSSRKERMRISNISVEQDNILTEIYKKLDEMLEY